MEARTIEAIHKSIAHWNDICYGMEGIISTNHCALCGMFHSYRSCGDCPLFTSGNCCRSDITNSNPGGHNPYADYYKARNEQETNYCTVASAEAAEAMLETLVGLLPKYERWVRYGAVKGSHGQWCFRGPNSGFSDGVNGITTDGRNRFPQAKEVWRQVFERQEGRKVWYVGAKSRYAPKKPMLTDEDKYTNLGDMNKRFDTLEAICFEGEDVGKALRKFKGECPTCGQEVKPKVVQFPKLMVSTTSGSIYLMTANTTGTKLTRGTHCRDNGDSIGSHSNTWKSYQLEDYDGEVNLPAKEFTE